MPAVTNVRVLIVLGILIVFGIITFALAAATLSTLNKRFSSLEDKFDDISSILATTTLPGRETTTTLQGGETTTTLPGVSTVTTSATTSATTSGPNLNSTLAERVRIDDLMGHLEAFERLANESGKTRAVATEGFVRTLQYIEHYLKTNATNLSVFRETFQVKNFSVDGTPKFNYSIDGEMMPALFYSTDLVKAEFTHVNYAAPINLTTFELVRVRNNACNDSDWGDVTDKAVLLIVGGVCTTGDKAETARKKNAAAVILYSNGLTTSNLAPSIVRLRQTTDLPALFLSHATGSKLANALTAGKEVNITIEIKVQPYGVFEVDNICADTNVGNRSETIVIGSHSDSVQAGPGINDNGSGSAANLVLAKILSDLYASGTYPSYRYRVRFCWWGAEEIGLIGSFAHVRKAKTATAGSGNSTADYLVNLNYDMLGSPNYFFGIYDGTTAKPGTPTEALPGSNKLTDAYLQWFHDQKLFPSFTDFEGGSDYAPFLAEGIAAGGLFSGADDVKTVEERDGLKAGLAGAIHDPCYHRDCDTVQNIDKYGYLKMVQAAAYMLEYLGRQSDLKTWLYPPTSG